MYINIESFVHDLRLRKGVVFISSISFSVRLLIVYLMELTGYY